MTPQKLEELERVLKLIEDVNVKGARTERQTWRRLLRLLQDPTVRKILTTPAPAPTRFSKALAAATRHEQTNVVMTAFTARHPDWKTYEPELLVLAEKVSPNGMTEGEYLDHLYTIVTALTPQLRLKTERARSKSKRPMIRAAQNESSTGGLRHGRVSRGGRP